MDHGKKPSLTVDAIVEREGKLLLIKRKFEPFKGQWALPGGFVEYGEKVEDALQREILEETGLLLRTKRFYGVYSDPERDPRGHVVSLCYIVEGEGQTRGGDDAEKVQFVSKKELSKLDLAFDHKQIISDYLEGRHVL